MAEKLIVPQNVDEIGAALVEAAGRGDTEAVNRLTREMLHPKPKAASKAEEPAEPLFPQFSVEGTLRSQNQVPDKRTRQLVAEDRRLRVTETLDADPTDKKLFGPVARTDIGAMDFYSTNDLVRAGVGGGLRDAAQEVLDGLKLFHDATGNVQEKLLEAVGVPEQFAKALSLDVELPEVGEAETTIGEIARPVVSFIAGFLPLNRALKAAGMTANLTRDVVASAGAGAMTMPRDAMTLADGLAQVPGLGEVVPEFLRSDPNDGTAEAKMKQAANEVLGVGVGSALVRPLMAGLKYARGARRMRETAGLEPRPDHKARINSWWLNGLVSGFSTQALNLGTNLANTLLVPAERLLATTLAHGPRQSFVEARSTAVGFLNGLEDAFRLSSNLKEAGTVQRAFVTGTAQTDPALTKIEPTNYIVEPPDLRTVFKGGPAAVVGNVLDTIVTSGFTGVTGARGLITGDEAFKTLLHRMELHRVAAKEGFELGFRGEDFSKYVSDRVLNPDEELLDQALNVARYGTFTQPLGEMGQAVLQFRNQVPLMKFFFPFLRTPTNIFKFALERTPLAPLMKEVRADLRSGDKFTQRLAQTRIAYGTALMALAGKWTMEGRITGGGPVDRELYNINKGNRPPYSFLVGDKWVAYQRFQPWGFVLGAAADLAEISGQIDNNKFDETHTAIVASIYRNTLDFPFTQGFSELANLLHNGLRGADTELGLRTLADIGSTFAVPRVISQFARADDPHTRAARTMLDQLKNQLPGYREDLPYMHDALGDEVVLNEGYGEGNLGVFTRMAVPFAMRKDHARLRDVREFLMEHEIDVGMPKRAVRGVPIDEETYQDMVKRQGAIAVPMVRQMMGSTAFSRMTREQKERRVKQAFAVAREAASSEVLASSPALQRRVGQLKAGFAEREDVSMQRGPLSLELPQ